MRRPREVIDLAVLQHVGYPECVLMDKETLQSACAELFTDLSQNPARKSFTNDFKISKCMTSSTILYCHA